MDYLKQRVDNLKIIVCDLDNTLWPFWVDSSVSPPFKCDSNGKITDSYGHRVMYYRKVPEVLNLLKSLGYTLGIASRTVAVEEAEELLKLLN